MEVHFFSERIYSHLKQNKKNDAWFGFDDFCLEIPLNFKGVSQK